MPRTSLHDWLLLSYLSIFWGLAFLLIALALDLFLPVTVVWIRLSLGALVMLCVMRAKGVRLPRGMAWWRRLTLLSLTGNVLPFCLIAWSELTVPSSEVGLLMALMPLTILVLGHFFIDQEPFTKTRLIGVVIGFAGVVTVMGLDLATMMSSHKLPGQLAAILATLCYAVNAILTKRLPPAESVGLTAGTLLCGAIILAPFALWLQPEWSFGTHQTAVVAVLVLGVFATGFATWAYFEVVAARGPGFLSSINYLIPFVAFFAGILFLGEPAKTAHFIALLMILLGVRLIQPRKSAEVKAFE